MIIFSKYFKPLCNDYSKLCSKKPFVMIWQQCIFSLRLYKCDKLSFHDIIIRISSNRQSPNDFFPDNLQLRTLTCV